MTDDALFMRQITFIIELKVLDKEKDEQNLLYGLTVIMVYEPFHRFFYSKI